MGELAKNSLRGLLASTTTAKLELRMSRPDLKAGGTKLAVIDHLTLHIYCACGHYAVRPSLRSIAIALRELF